MAAAWRVQLGAVGRRPRTCWELHRQQRQMQPRQPQQQRRLPRPCQAAAGGLQEGLSTVGLLPWLELPGSGGWWQALQLAVVGLAGYAAAVWPDRPRGWCRKDLVQVRESGVEGLGVFATAPIPAGTVLGAYPGRPRSPADMTSKVQGAAPAAAFYCFQTDSGWVLDPTDASGQPSAWPGPGLPWLPVDSSLSRVNEPPAGHPGGPSVEIQDDPGDPRGLLMVAVRDIAPGEELFLDYGPVYNRSGYGGT